ncbi:MAG: A/G-specific adenine glycosylase [Dermatophilaceae bacterium]
MTDTLPKVPSSLLHQRILDWYAKQARDLPWREAGTSPWGVLVSEIMLQQTPVVRVEPVWRLWMRRWPSPAALAAATTGDAIRAWGRLGYPRRALRLHAAAVTMVERHDGDVPESEEELLALPGVGSYTAAAVSAFAFGRRATVIDTNVRRVLARIVNGVALAAPSLTRAETDLATLLLPRDADISRKWNAAVMEVGAVVCSARSPRCPDCPVRDLCAWQLAGRPEYEGSARRTQSWLGTDRQCRGAILAVLRRSKRPVTARAVGAAWANDDAQRDRCLDSLVADGLVEPLPRNRFCLPGR